MIKITVCVGSACYMKGSRQVVAILRRLIEENGLAGQRGVCVELNGKTYSLTPDNTEEFFRTEILKTA